MNLFTKNCVDADWLIQIPNAKHYYYEACLDTKSMELDGIVDIAAKL